MWPEKEVPAESSGLPTALASHEDVVQDRNLFFNTLRSFHTSLGSKFMIPVIGGKELDLHVLYLEVTRRGGYGQVVSEKKWREISTVFDFSPTTTSASYALRKHYLSILHGYEHLYFFRRPASSLSTLTTEPSFEAIGTIDGKFDCGYLVSVRLGDETLTGVLYHPGQTNPTRLGPHPCTTIVPYGKLHQTGRRARNRRRRGGDPNHPKPNRSGYNFFFAEKHSELKSQYPNREREFTKMIGESWNSLSAEEREVYQEFGMKDKERYQKEMKEYNERLNMERQH